MPYSTENIRNFIKIYLDINFHSSLTIVIISVLSDAFGDSRNFIDESLFCFFYRMTFFRLKFLTKIKI